MSGLIVACAGAGYLYYEYLNSKLSKEELHLGRNKLDDEAPNAAGQTPLNILLIGSDSRNSEENLQLGGSKASVGSDPLADVQMLLHVAADRSNMSVVSVPRDTLVTIPECTDPKDGTVYPEESAAQINTSLQHGGPGCTVAAWEELTGVPVDHFVMVDFAGVVQMADAVGGVPVCVRDNVDDPKSGLRLEKGTTVVQGEQALQWLRTRHGFEDGSDIGRAHAQHQYMNAMVRELKAGTKLTDPGKLRALASAATDALTVDDGLGSIKKLHDLAGELKRVPAGRITMTTMPFAYAPQDPNRVIPQEGDADQLWTLLREDRAFDGKGARDDGSGPASSPAPDADPAPAIAVTVRNGTGTAAQAPVTGRAGEISEHLAGLGFTGATTDATPASQADTTLTYGSAEERGNALAVAEALGLPRQAVRQSAQVPSVTLVIGADWRTDTRYPEEAAAEPPGKAPDSANPLVGDDESACMEVNPGYTW
nr:LCP family protein [Streptomyces sp. CMB-StM0423]